MCDAIKSPIFNRRSNEKRQPAKGGVYNKTRKSLDFSLVTVMVTRRDDNEKCVTISCHRISSAEIREIPLNGKGGGIRKRVTVTFPQRIVKKM